MRVIKVPQFGGCEVLEAGEPSEAHAAIEGRDVIGKTLLVI
ncbi:MAG: hypothetical protein ABSA91_17375 [Acidimicrobiales bacterium]|jgi:hypothetical protein